MTQILNTEDYDDYYVGATLAVALFAQMHITNMFRHLPYANRASARLAHEKLKAKMLTSNTTHIIHRQRYELTVASQQQGRQLQQQLQQFNLQHLLPELNNRLNEWFAKADQIITIDKIDIDLGQIHPSTASSEWLEKIIHQLQKQLQPIISEKVVEETSRQSINIQKTDTAIYATEAFLFFLENGLLPQASIYTSRTEVIEALQQMGTAEQAALKDKLATVTIDFSIQRLLMLPTEQLYFFVHLFIPELSLAEWNNWLTNLIEQSKILTTNKASLQEQSQPQSLTPQQQMFFLLTQLLQEESKDQNLSWNRAKQLVQEQAGEWLNEQQQTTGDAKKQGKLIKPIKEFKKFTTRPDKELITEAGVFITNAGICLTAAYLPMFFKALQLTDGAAFLSNFLQQKAIHLLHFLAAGDEDASEEKLVLTKLLCGWPLQMPLTEKIILTDEEKTEANDLLKSMIEHWQALKSTSPDGLRQAFLQRSGKLSDKEDNFLLQVEHQSLDILLDQIPWFFHLIKLPWMKNTVTVEWY